MEKGNLINIVNVIEALNNKKGTSSNLMIFFLLNNKFLNRNIIFQI